MEWIDLTQTISEEMSGVYLRQFKNLKNDGWNAKLLEIYTHAGTHMDAPIHFGMPGPTIDKFPFERLRGNAWIADCTDIQPSDLINVENLGPVKSMLNAGDNLIIKTGWAKFADTDPVKYRDQLPRISTELANFLVDIKLNILAVEPPSIADVNNLKEVTLIHKILFSGQIIIIEGLCNLHKINASKVELIALPLKIKDGDGAPARVFARPIQ